MTVSCSTSSNDSGKVVHTRLLSSSIVRNHLTAGDTQWLRWSLQVWQCTRSASQTYLHTLLLYGLNGLRKGTVAHKEHGIRKILAST